MKPKKPSKTSAESRFANTEIQHIEQLLRFMTEHNLEEFEYAQGDLKISAPAGSAPSPAPESGRSTDELHLVKSPIVGTFYESPSPGAEAFVKIGGFIEAGQTLCVVEAMKLMNEIESDVSGEVLRIFAENGQPVEYGQPLFGIRPSRKK